MKSAAGKLRFDLKPIRQQQQNFGNRRADGAVEFGPVQNFFCHAVQ